MMYLNDELLLGYVGGEQNPVLGLPEDGFVVVDIRDGNVKRRKAGSSAGVRRNDAEGEFGHLFAIEFRCCPNVTCKGYVGNALK